MANRAINMWRANTLVSGWSKDQVTVNTTGLHIITVQINDPTYQDATVDGQTIRSNALILLASPDPVSPSADPFVSMQVVSTVFTVCLIMEHLLSQIPVMDITPALFSYPEQLPPVFMQQIMLITAWPIMSRPWKMVRLCL